MNKVELPAVTAERVLGMIALRETTRKLLDCQLHDGSDAEVQLLQNELKQQYTAFKAQYALNLRDTKIYDTIHDADGDHRVLNKQETMLAQQAQESIREAFKQWIFKGTVH